MVLKLSLWPCEPATGFNGLRILIDLGTGFGVIMFEEAFVIVSFLVESVLMYTDLNELEGIIVFTF